ncbi:MAG TPA: hypothetical protein VHV83_09775 [Armatimonadota bacterium]|nr:hypothetical protein [Armatimonadota bacterium]
MKDNRFPVVPVIATILKVIAVIIFLFFVIQAIQGFVTVVGGWKGGVGQFGQPVPAVTGFGQKLATLAGPFSTLLIGTLIATLTWGFADLINMIRRLVVGRTEENAPATNED